jgi:predicted phosphohydrolase
MIRYLSDLHLEFIRPHKINKFIQLIKPDPNQICILAGDIGNPYSPNYDEFMKHMDKSFRRTFVIAGNHEYYNKSIPMAETREHMKNYFKQYDNISFLDNSSEVYDGRLFVGSTLWTKITKPAYQINDTSCIPNFNHILYNSEHRRCCEYLKAAIESATLPVVVITHHVPSFDFMAEKYKSCVYNEWFYCNMNDFIYENRGRIQGWFYGHTHTYCRAVLHGVSFFCNPIGYIGENADADFDAVAYLWGGDGGPKN